MGMYDTITVEPKIVEQYNLKCPICGKVCKDGFQTKDLESCMGSYYLKYDEQEKMRLYKLDEPSDIRYWYSWTELDIEEFYNGNRDKPNGLGFLFERKAGEGYWEQEAYLPENRRQRHMGELPHQYLYIYNHCGQCGYPSGSMDISLKFTDGVVEKIEINKKKEGIDDTDKSW